MLAAPVLVFATMLAAPTAAAQDEGGEQEPAPSRLADRGPMLGDLRPDGAAVWLRAASPGDVVLELRPRGEGDTVRVAGRASAETDLTVRLDALGLATGTVYDATLSGAGPPHDFELATPHPHDEVPRARLAFASCANDLRFAAQPVWTRIAEARPDALVLLGDTPYIDSTELAVQRARRRAFLGQSQLAPLLALQPVYMTWDDHDYGRNDTVGALEGSAASRRALIEYSANPAYGEEGEGIYTSFRRGPVEVFLLDTRWFGGSAPSPADPEKRTLLGARQWAWLLRGLAESKAPVKVLASGMIWNGSVRPFKLDHWEHWAHERDAIFRHVGEARISGVVLVGGDIHRSRVVRHVAAEALAGYAPVELITSPAANFVIEAANQPHPGLLWDAGVPATSLLLDVAVEAGRPAVTARFIDGEGTALHVHELEPKDLGHER